MAENQNKTSGAAPINQKRFAAARKNRLLLYIGHALGFIAILLLVAGANAKGTARDSAYVVAFGLMFAATRLVDSASRTKKRED